MCPHTRNLRPRTDHFHGNKASFFLELASTKLKSEISWDAASVGLMLENEIMSSGHQNANVHTAALSMLALVCLPLNTEHTEKNMGNLIRHL